MARILTVLGTRPEAIKLAPVLRELDKDSDFDSHLCSTGQHRQMLNQMLRLLQLNPDMRLSMMRAGQSLNTLSGRLLMRLDKVLAQLKPDAVLVQGDTTTAFTAAFAAFQRQIAVGHVEAGLRTYDPSEPFPEELNRQLISRLARWHFVPTEHNKANLLGEGSDEAQIFVTGNTVIDALQAMCAQVAKPTRRAVLLRRLPAALRKKLTADPPPKMILVTGHRRESFGPGLKSVCSALAELPKRLPGTEVVFPVHLNPQVLTPVKELLSAVPGVHLLPPVDYETFVWLMQRCWLLVSDSGGVQEEAPALNKPVLVTRNNTERQEAVAAGTVRLVGTDRERILQSVVELHEDAASYQRMAEAPNPYGDGRAAERIVAILREQLA